VTDGGPVAAGETRYMKGSRKETLTSEGEERGSRMVEGGKPRHRICLGEEAKSTIGANR